MEIRNSIPQQSFGARYILTGKIKEKIPFLPFYKQVNVDFVELDRKFDIPAITKYVSKDLDSDIGQPFLTNFQYTDDTTNYKAYALTRQQINHSELDPNQIVGICDGNYIYDEHNKKYFFIENLETKSINNIYKSLENKKISIFGIKFTVKDKIKDVGKAIIKSILSIQRADVNSIKLESLTYESDAFYYQMGFQKDKSKRYGFYLPNKKFQEVLNK